MIIFGIDCAVENLGIAIVRFDENWQDKIQMIINQLHELYGNVSTLSKTEFVSHSMSIITNADKILSQILIVEWFNVIDLIPGNLIDEVPAIERIRRVKGMLSRLDQQFNKPDLVLIEYQMGPNDIARMISVQIAHHYMTDIDVVVEQKTKDLRKLRKKDDSVVVPVNTITYAVGGYPLIGTDGVGNNINDKIVNTNDTTDVNTADDNKTKHTQVEFVGPTVKNKYHIAPDGAYENFIVKNSNYIANKKHCVYNFQHFVKNMITGGGKIIDNIANKADDMSDAFMMIFGYLKIHKLL
jgi:hypothetical protein